MNRQRFLAELSQLLSFMAEHDRAAFLKEITARFDEVGPEGEYALISRFGTPTVLAVKASRGYKPSELFTPAEDTAEEPAEQADIQPPEAEETPEAIEAPVENEPEVEAETEAEPEVEPEPDPEPEMQPAVPEAVLSELFGADSSREEVKPEPEKKRMPRGRGALIALTISGGALLLVLILALAAVVLAPGAAGIVSAALFGLAGLWASYVITDALFLFGIALVALSLGVLLLFLALWLLVIIIKPLVSGVVYLFRLTGGEGK